MIPVLPLKRPYFSSHRGRELAWLLFCWLIAAVSALILVLAWPQTRSLELIATLHQWCSTPAVYFFKAISFLGEDEFYMLFIGVILWCINKSLGFWTMVMLLTSGFYSSVIKALTFFERPPLEGVTHPSNTAFPSGHTLTTVTVWGYLALRLKKTGFTAWAVFLMAVMGLSRMVLGHHYLGDVLGGVALGIPFLLFFIWLSVQCVERGWAEKLSTPLLLAVSLIGPIVLTAVIPGADFPKQLGYLAGAAVGYILEKKHVRSSTATALPLQFVKVILGLAVLFGIVSGLGGVLPAGGPDASFAEKMPGFIRYALGGIWSTLLAPSLFVILRLTPREPAGQRVQL